MRFPSPFLTCALLALLPGALHAQSGPAIAARSPMGQAPHPANLAPRMQLEIAVSDSSTTYLVFPGPVSLVDVGQAPHYLVKIESNAVFVRAKRRNPPPTPILVRYGSRYWMGHLVYTGRPVLQLYDFQDGGALGASAGNSARNGAGLSDALALNQGQEKRELAETRLSKLATAKHADTGGLRTAENDLVLSLANVRNDKDFTYLRLKLRNTTSIDYAVDFTDFELVENSRKKFLGKKKNEARRPLAPAGGAESQTIPARETGYLLYAVPLYAATDRGHLEITLREKFGARVLVLKVPSKVINTAAAI
ncbi:DUF4138 domain-containing protein [Hymenobacter psychrotolerans]|uniref:Bacteroides conjugative transposon TraN protein n=1 Tax=Hymenobacter psychrotolerans DSM 18569 TaxID=1121959 RepID=A0A1M7G192_9BACT|nr:DUF4138 domain-containing protein [Hymenobacter psychrotolerans]SHM09687.1 protein of unknown function [Hymenobacter psychrotolerans DSM 18569]